MNKDLLQLNPPPESPGVYQFKDIEGEIIYIGKAKNLNNRVRSYFNTSHPDAKTRRLAKTISDVEYILTDNELEALILENALIKRHKPKFNIKLRDDKNYQFIKIDYTREIPQIYSVRNRTPLSSPRSKGEKRGVDVKYFGPYTSGRHVRNTLRLIKKIFPYCQARKVSTRPCFNYHLHRCPGVCIGKISQEEYKQTISKVELFLKGSNKNIEKDLEKKMNHASEQKKYEKAAALRDQLKALRSLSEEQKVIYNKSKNQDYISIYKKKGKAVINLFIVRSGKLLAKENVLMDNTENESYGKIISVFLENYYSDATNLPREVLLESKTEDGDLLTRFLEKRFTEVNGIKRKIRIKVPKIGTAKKLIKLGKENAQYYLEQQLAKFEKEESIIKRGLAELKELLDIKSAKRIECFDISNVQGKYAVGSMTVFENGKPNKDQYRKFRIRTKSTPDDYAMMTEILSRRLKNDWPKPNLWVIDGGKGQLNAALKVLKTYNKDIPVIALGKPQKSSVSEFEANSTDKIFLPDRGKPVTLKKGNPALTLLQRLRDEAHRFAITYYRKVHARSLFNEKY